jgi:hypothetical protein
MQAFYKDFQELIWITYRSHFRPLLIEKIKYQGKKVENLTTDCKWGCTIRAAQMLLANAIRRFSQDFTTTEILDL